MSAGAYYALEFVGTFSADVAVLLALVAEQWLAHVFVDCYTLAVDVDVSVEEVVGCLGVINDGWGRGE